MTGIDRLMEIPVSMGKCGRCGTFSLLGYKLDGVAICRTCATEEMTLKEEY